MVDAFAIMKANRAGYEVFWLIEGKTETAWFRKVGSEESTGPFKTLDEAARAALDAAEEQHWKDFWRRKDDESS